MDQSVISSIRARYGSYDGYLTFKNDCLNILYTSLPSYAYWYEIDNEEVELNYWSEYKEKELMILSQYFGLETDKNTVKSDFTSLVKACFF
jgi:hypothetical protein